MYAITPGAPSLRQLIICFISVSFVGFKNSEGFMLSDKNCLCETLLSGILDASAGPMFTKFLLKPSAIVFGSVFTLLLCMNLSCIFELFFLLITCLMIAHTFLRLFLLETISD